MRLLLDSHVLLWSIDKPHLLSNVVRDAMLDGDNDLYVSVASMWEIAIKAGAGKLQIPEAPAFLETHLREIGVRDYLSITLAHTRNVKKLPPIHKDPFDRMLVAQAITERMSLVSKDEQFRQYPVKLLW